MNKLIAQTVFNIRTTTNFEFIWSQSNDKFKHDLVKTKSRNTHTHICTKTYIASTERWMAAFYKGHIARVWERERKRERSGMGGLDFQNFRGERKVTSYVVLYALSIVGNRDIKNRDFSKLLCLDVLLKMWPFFETLVFLFFHFLGFFP